MSSHSHLNRDELLAQANEILNRAILTKEDSARAEGLMKLADQLTDKTELRHGIIAQRNRELGRLPKYNEVSSEQDKEFRLYLCQGKEGLSTRALGVLTDAGGNFLVPLAFADCFETILKQRDGLFDVATLFEPERGSACGFPVLDDVGNAAAIVAENTASTQGPDLVFDVLTFDKIPQWRTGMIRASTELINDANFDIGTLVADASAVRMARGVGASFVTSLLSQATLGKTAASATAIAPDEIFDLVDSVDNGYATNGSFLMRRATLTYIWKVKASTGGSYLFPPQFDINGRPLLCGYPVYISPSMPAIATTAKTITFGDHSRFIRRQVRGSLAVNTLVERYAEFGQVAYETFLRVDGGLAKSGTNVPVKYLQQA